jgi:flagellar hook capping protein FlgD
LQRVLSTVVLLGLLFSTAAAFAITEHLKLAKSPVFGTLVSKRFSPTCGCARGKAKVSIRLRRPDDVTVRVLGPGRKLVRTLASGRHEPHGRAVFVWDGATDLGPRAPDGVYQPEIHLARQHRTILLPNRIVLDTRPPKVLSASVSRNTISPDGDHIGDSIKILYRFDEPAHALVYLGTQLVIRSHGAKPDSSVTWYGKVDGIPLPAGIYKLRVGGSDLVGNLTPAAERHVVLVRVRYIRLTHSRIVVGRPSVRFGVGVDTDARRYEWTLAGRHGTASRRVLLLHAPKKPGRYTLVVTEHGHSDQAALVVRTGR